MSLTTQFYTMLSMIAMGSFFGASLDTYGRFLKRPKRKKWIVFINDILFWIFQGLFIFYVLFIVNEGEVRLYIFLALLCGYAAYQSLLKNYYLKILERIIHICILLFRMIVQTVNNIVIHPIKWIITTLIALSISLLSLVKSLIHSIWKLSISILKFILSPFLGILKLLWKIMPKSVKIFFEKMYNKIGGFFSFIKNKFTKDKD